MVPDLDEPNPFFNNDSAYVNQLYLPLSSTSNQRNRPFLSLKNITDIYDVSN